MTAFSKTMRKLLRNRSGVAMTEFAMATPFLLGIGLFGIEVANLTITHMKINQVAMQVADNTSRIGEISQLDSRKIFEEDIYDIMVGADLHARKNLELFEHGRIFVSGLELYDMSVHCLKKGCPSTSSSEGKSFIWWQRCFGKLDTSSTYGSQNEALPKGMGPEANPVLAEEGESVIFVELQYDYQPLFSSWFLKDTMIQSIASFTVRNDRDRTEIYRKNALGTPKDAKCSEFTGLS